MYHVISFGPSLEKDQNSTAGYARMEKLAEFHGGMSFFEFVTFFWPWEHFPSNGQPQTPQQGSWHCKSSCTGSWRTADVETA